MRAAALFSTLFWATAAQAQTVVCTGADLCPAGGPTCDLIGAYEVAAGCSGIDLAGIDVAMTAGSSLTTTDQSLALLAGSWTMESGSEISLPTPAFGTESLAIEATGAIDIDGLIDLQAGNALLLEGATVTVDGVLDVRNGIEVSASSDLIVNGDLSDRGASGGSSGIALSAGGDVEIHGSITSCCETLGFEWWGGGPVVISAAGDVLVGATGVIDQTADAPSDLDITITADGTIAVEGALIADGSEYELLLPSYEHVCADGGRIALASRADLVVSGTASSRGTDVCNGYGCGVPDPYGVYGCFDDSAAGEIAWSALGQAAITGSIDTGAQVAASGSAGAISAGALLDFSGTWTAVDAPGGGASLISGAGDISLTGAIGSANELDLSAAATYGTTTLTDATLSTRDVTLDGCLLHLTGTTAIDSTGGHTFWFRDGGSIDSTVTSTAASHTLEYFGTAPTLMGTLTPSAAATQTAPDCTGPDADTDGVEDGLDLCPGFDDAQDVDGDTVPDGCDVCPLDAFDDSDGDGSCDSDDTCPGYDDAIDQDLDGLPDPCDPCPTEFANDADGDGLCPSVDPCPADPLNDADADGVCGDVDACEGFDDAIDADADGVPDLCDICPNDPLDDGDSDGVCDSSDVCLGFDDYTDTDTDGVPDGCDPCPLDIVDDFDLDGVCESEDACPGHDDNLDRDADGIPDDCDLCPDSATGDSDGDGTCDNFDVCPGFNDDLDADGDEIPDDCDLCPNDYGEDEDGDGICDGDDPCIDPTNSADGDGDGTPSACDCDDDDALVGPDAREVCDGRDNDCDGDVDEGCGEEDGGKGGCGCDHGSPVAGLWGLAVILGAIRRRSVSSAGPATPAVR